MYVTRRLLRSTLSDATPEALEEKQPSSPPPVTPKRRAAARATAKMDADSVGRITTKSLENADNEKNKRRAKRKDKQVPETPKSAESKLYGCGMLVDVRYRNEFIEAKVVDLDPHKETIYVHYMGWNARYDAWVTPEDVAAHGSESLAKKKDVSWDGETSLFVTKEEAVKLKAKSKKSPKSKKFTQKIGEGKEKKRRAVETSEEPPKKIRKSPKNKKSSKKSGKKSPKRAKGLRNVKNAEVAEVEAEPEHGTKSPRVRRPSRKVQVAVGTTDEASERKKKAETADLVLEVEIGAGNAAIEEGNAVEEQVESGPTGRAKKQTHSKVKSKRKRKSAGEVEEDEDFVPEKKDKKSKRGGAASSKSPASTAQARRPGNGGLSGPIREKLRDIFQQRVQQREQMEQLTAAETGLHQSLETHEEDEAAAAEVDSAKEDATPAAMVSPNAATDEYQRQLQQYYYHQQLLLAMSLSSGMAGAEEDPSTIALHGGIIDPRIIQERLSALEERRRQQAQIQAYYQQLMLTRERNVRALAANQAFVNASSAVWEQQLKESTQSEEDSTSIKSWKDMTGNGGNSADKDDNNDSTADKDPEIGKGGGDHDAPRSEKSDTSDGGDNSKESETSAAVSTSSAANEANLASPDTVEKAAEGSVASTQSTPAKSASKCDPADAPSENVLYEFIL